MWRTGKGNRLSALPDDCSIARSLETIGEFSAFRGGRYATSDGSLVAVLSGTAVLANAVATVRVADFTGSTPNLDQAASLLFTVVERGREEQDPGYRNLGTDVAPLPYSLGDEVDRYFASQYTAYDGALFRRSPPTQ